MSATRTVEIDPWYLDNLVCPRDGTPLRYKDHYLVSQAGNVYPVVEGIPVMLIEGAGQTLWVAEASRRIACETATAGKFEDPYFIDAIGVSPEEIRLLRELIHCNTSPVDPVVSILVGATNGNMYKHLIGRLESYPIPKLPLPPGKGESILDVGCNWGRWCIAAAKQGYRPVGIDPSLGAVLAAKRVAKQLGLEARFVVGDARFLPFRPGTFDRAFSYSVIQHFSREDAGTTIRNIGKVLKPGGSSLVQMPTVFGIRCLYHQIRRGFREGTGFEVRYWTISNLKRLFQEAIGSSSVFVDCYFGLGLQQTDRQYMRRHLKMVLLFSEGFRQLSKLCPPLKYLADSMYIRSEKSIVQNGSSALGRFQLSSGEAR